ncbi:hypothetical protein ACMD2_01815 [Ananas comosus]|uniref:Glycosyltransferase BC10 n=1 Tax=Ananas comosus TaxID=4615 RepID=A0A199VW24_ANACO|nr:hypothetical protein ACMD2_01815 [Ananas comosus]
MLSTYSSPFVLSLLLLLSLPILFLLGPAYSPPRRSPRSRPRRDRRPRLFRRATLAADAGSGGGDGGAVAASLRRRPAAQPKVAFLFLTNSDLSFAPLWERFFRGHERLFNVYVHADPSSRLLLAPTPSFRRRFIPAKATQRASPTLISAARRLLAAALLDDPANAFFALVSQHCPGLWDRYVARGDAVMLPEVPFHRFRVGSQFFVLARRHAVLVVRDRRLWKKFRLPCLRSMKDSCYPEEHYFPTLLDMQDPQGCTRYTLTRVNWTDSVGGHPHTYRPWEISGDLIHELRRSNSTYSYMFARKFSPDCLDPLLAIADSVIFRD